MNEGLKFGEEAAKSLQMGDIVEWSKWNPQEEEWNLLNGGNQEIEFFTLSLRLVSPSKREELSTEFNS